MPPTRRAIPIELLLVGLAGVALLAGWLVSVFGGPHALSVGLLVTSAVLSSTQTFPEAVRLLRRLALDVDVLMFAAAIGAAVLGHYVEGALLLFLFGLGTAGETMAVGRSRRAIEALTRLAPDSALRLDAHNVAAPMPLAELNVGDRVLLKPYDRVAVDATIIDGQSDVDESPLTGESVPVSKRENDSVFAGTLNGSGRLIVRVVRNAGESTLSRIVKLVEEAQAQRSPTQLFTDRIERIYVPVIFCLTLVLIVLPPLCGLVPRMNPHSIWGGWFYQSMAFLTAASPCALAIGTPTAVLCGIARAARMGVLVKGGAHLETLGKLRAIAFDKTGTITAGRPTVDRIEIADHVAVTDVLGLAAAVDSHTSHPYAASIVDAASAHHATIPTAINVRQIPGEGVIGEVDGAAVSVGKSSLAGDIATWPVRLREAYGRMQTDGLATAVVARDGALVGVLGLLDRPRESARSAIERLRQSGIRNITMLTGDHAAVARLVADRVGLNDVHADLLPAEKLSLIESLGKTHGTIAMIGDGVNDAPALAKADLGVAMNATQHAASEVAVETADIVLMGGDLNRLADAISLARRARRIITQNLVIALGIICVIAPLAALGFAGLGWAVLLHEGSTVVVVLNALRLLREQEAQTPSRSFQAAS